MSRPGTVPSAAETGLFSDPKYKSTNSMAFRGQDKAPSNLLGQNPNQFIREEYISNLQQQVHFMELEMKILREKVLEDEKKSGIGSLFDDDKKPHQHIVLLKEKYMQMRKDFEKKKQDNNKLKLDVIGEQFILDSQLRTLNDQTSTLTESRKDYDDVFLQQRREMEKKNKETQANRLNLESECRDLNNTNERESQENYQNTMYLKKRDATGALAEARFERDEKLLNAMLEAKNKEKQDIVDERTKLKSEFEAMKEVQDLIDKENTYRDEIEEMQVRLQFLAIRINTLEASVEGHLTEKKDQLDRDKKFTAEQNEDLERQRKAKEENNQKRLVAKLQRDKNPHLKELQQKLEDCTESNEEFAKKLREESDKLDTLVDNYEELFETHRLTVAKKTETTEKIKEQEDKIAKIKDEIDKKQASVDDRLKIVEEARRVNLIEDEKNRKYSKANAALRAKLEFIEQKYDYTSSAKILKLDDFKDLINSNAAVNNTIEGFNTKLADIQKEIQQIEATKNLL